MLKAFATREGLALGAAVRELAFRGLFASADYAELAEDLTAAERVTVACAAEFRRS